jgi:hypothetical protein
MVWETDVFLGLSPFPRSRRTSSALTQAVPLFLWAAMNQKSCTQLTRSWRKCRRFSSRTIATRAAIAEPSPHESNYPTVEHNDHCTPSWILSNRESGFRPKPFKLYSKNHIPSLLARYAPHLDPDGYVAAATVFPMRTNDYVVEELIDWSNVPNDPIFKLVFPQPDMLSQEDFSDVRKTLSSGSSQVTRRGVA